MNATHRMRFDLAEQWLPVAFVPKGSGSFDVVNVESGEIVGGYDKHRKLYSWDVFETHRNYQIAMIREDVKGKK